jgi:hypothetical protein
MPKPPRPGLAGAAAIAALLAVAGPGLAPAAAQTPAPQGVAQQARTAALTQLTPQNAVMIYVDFVTGLDNLMTTIPAQQFHNNIEAFAKTSQLFKMPTLVLGEETQYYGKFLPAMKPVIDSGAKRVNRTTPTGYTPEVRDWLRQQGRRNVIIGGISIDNCTMLTSLDMLREGYNVYVVVDVSSTNSRLVEDAALMRLVQAGAVPVNWLNVLTELGGDFAAPHGRQMMEIIQAHWPASTTGEVRDLTPDGAGFQPVRR